MKISQIIQEHPSLFQLRSGSDQLTFASLTPFSEAKPGSTVVVSKPADAQLALEKGASVVITCYKTDNLPVPLSQNQTWVQGPSTSHCLAVLLKYFEVPLRWSDVNLSTKRNGVEIHSSAVVDPTAKIGKGSVIGPLCVIEPNAEIGENCHLRAQVFIGERCKIGNRVLIASGTCIGSDGFGYHRNKDKSWLKIPQIGIVRIEDDVEIGSNCSIDRATLTETVIKRGTKLDNIIHIAHNSEIGEDCALAGGFMCAGSIKMGNFCMTGGTVVVSDHTTIANDVSLGGRTAVTQSITEPGAYLGHPAQPVTTALKIQAVLTQLPDMRKQVQRLMKKVFENESSN